MPWLEFRRLWAFTFVWIASSNLLTLQDINVHAGSSSSVASGNRLRIPWTAKVSTNDKGAHIPAAAAAAAAADGDGDTIGNENSNKIAVVWFGRGGGNFQKSDPAAKAAATSNIINNNNKNATVKEYVAAVEEKDAQLRTHLKSDGQNKENSNDNNEEENDKNFETEYVCDNAMVDEDNNNDNERENNDPTEAAKEVTNNDSEESNLDSAPVSAEVGVKSHHQHKKSNAVGDPDGDDSDDDSDETTEEWEEFDDDLEDLDNMLVGEPSSQLQVELEMVEDEIQQDDMEDVEEDDQTRTARASGGGGVARLGQRLGRRKVRNGRKEWQTSDGNGVTPSDKNKNTAASVENEEIIDAWMPHVYLPPSPDALAYLVKNARLIDASSKTRLDRRTLYSGLLLEWLNQSASNRKFLDSLTSQYLQAALSLATQPQWRRAYPRANAIRLFENEVGKSCTLGMQETIAMALAHSLGAAMVILDDEILMSVRQKLTALGYANDEVKTAALVRVLLESAQEGHLNKRAGGSIAKCMKQDLSAGLDDPYDDRASASCEDMVLWEKDWHDEKPAARKERPLPLLIFIRTQCAHSLLKSRSAVDFLLNACNSEDSVNLAVLGSGIDSRTVILPKDGGNNNFNRNPQQLSQMPGPGWDGLSQQNQNASGQNDPEGSRRFNIFLARTLDHNGNMGILGAIAPPQAGNLFPHMMAMQARERLRNEDEDSPARADLERWSQLLIQQMQHSGQNNENPSVPPPQFFNASLGTPFGESENPLMPPNSQPPPQEVIQRTLEHALSELLDRLADMNDDREPPPTSPSELSPDLHKAFAQVLRNENIRRGIADNLARAAPALSDPKCQGVMLSVYVPPPKGNGKLPGASGKPQNNVGGWFQKILHNQEAADAAAAAAAAAGEEIDEGRRKKARQKRARTMAAMHAVMAAKNAEDSEGNKKNEKQDNKAERNLAKLESICRGIPIKAPADPVRAKSWEGWIARERGAVIFRRNRKALNEELQSHDLSLQQHTGTRGAGSSLRQMLSVRDVTEEMDEVIKCAVELEAAKGQRLHETPEEIHENEMDLGVDITLSQLLLTDDGEIAMNSDVSTGRNSSLKFLHPSSLEKALSLTCRVSPSPSGGLSLHPASHRTKEEIAAMAQDKHERALVSQVVSPQDIGVTYDMIGGLSDVKELLRQSITYPLKFPHLYSEGIAREAVKGVLLFGPPGTGKTMLAKAVATEGGASFLSVDASSVENKWLGESEKNAKAVFTLARRLAPCVIFVDEVDSLLSSREGTSDDSAHGTLTSVKTTMMSEWDGLNSGTNGNGEAGSDRVVVIGSTNRPFDLDEAVLRRFPRRILVDLPDLDTRREILEVTLAENRLDPDVNLTAIAERLEGYTGSDIKEVCREAVVQISHEQAKLLDQGFTRDSDSREDITQGSLQRLRPVNMADFESALSKLKRSVSEKGRELARVWEWNDEYGEIKKEKKNHLPHLMNMYL